MLSTRRKMWGDLGRCVAPCPVASIPGHEILPCRGLFPLLAGDYCHMSLHLLRRLALSSEKLNRAPKLGVATFPSIDRGKRRDRRMTRKTCSRFVIEIQTEMVRTLSQPDLRPEAAREPRSNFTAGSVSTPGQHHLNQTALTAAPK